MQRRTGAVIMETNEKEEISLIYAFKRSRIASALVFAASVLVTVLIWVRDREYPVYIPLIASVLMLAIGCLAARLLGNVLASMENTRYLGYLHMELDPKKFLEYYREVPGRMKGHSAAVAKTYLADGYWADGQFEKAVETVGPSLPETDPALRGLYATKLAAYFLAMENTEEAAKVVAVLEEVIDGCRLKKPDLARNFQESLTLYRQQENCLTGETVDTSWLEDAFASAQYNIRRLEIQKVLAMTALRDGNRKEKEKALSYLRKNGGKTDFKRWADRKG